jgi:Zn-dependent alcohol dehydrogenases
MRVAVLREYHRPLELEELPVPEPTRPRDVLVRIGGAASARPTSTRWRG